ncbi:MAG: hypothetical protein AB7I27_09065 [Bacteriovoracaceae bacterium]
MSRPLILFILAVILSIGIYAGGFNLTSYQANVGYVTTVEEFSVCKDVKNAGSKALFIPTKTDAEWTAMYSNPPAGITISAPANGATCCASQCACTKTCSIAY